MFLSQVFKVLGRFAAARPGLLERAVTMETRVGKLQKRSVMLPEEGVETEELQVPPRDSVPLIQRPGVGQELV